jgi:hypothetical protein
MVLMVCNNVEKFGNENSILRNTVSVTSLVQEYKTRIYHTDKTGNHVISSVRKDQLYGLGT